MDELSEAIAMNSADSKRESGMSPAMLGVCLIFLCLVPAWDLAFDPIDAESDFAIEHVANGVGAFGRLFASLWMFPFFMIFLGLQDRNRNARIAGISLRHASLVLAIAVVGAMVVRAVAFEGPRLHARAKTLTEMSLQYESLVARNHICANFLQEKIASGDTSVADLESLRNIMLSDLPPAPKWAASNGK